MRFKAYNITRDIEVNAETAEEMEQKAIETSKPGDKIEIYEYGRITKRVTAANAKGEY